MDNDQISAALKGATLAFRGQRPDGEKQKTSLSVKPVSRTPNLARARNNKGALQAATQASREYDTTMSRSSSAQGVREQSTGGSYDDVLRPSPEPMVVSQRLSQYLGSSPPAGNSHRMLAHGGKLTPDPKSASFIAATLAASRTGSPGPVAPGQGHLLSQVQLQSLDNISTASSSTSLDLTDTRPIPSTNSLISMFETREGKQEDVGLQKRSAEQVTLASGPARETRLPTPVRWPSPSRQQVLHAPSKTPPPRPASSSNPRPTMTPEAPSILEGTGNKESLAGRRLRAQKLLVGPSLADQEDSISIALQPKSVPTLNLGSSSQVIRRADTPLLSPRPRRMVKTPALVSAAFPGMSPEKRPASSLSDSSSDDTFVSASSNPSPRQSSPVRGRPLSIADVQSRISRPGLEPTDSTSCALDRPSFVRVRATPSPGSGNARPPSTPPSLALDSLTSAMLASNLASTRLSGPVRNTSMPPPLPPARRHNAHHHLPNPLNALKSTHTVDSGKVVAAAPRQGTLLQTLRQPASRSDDEDTRQHVHRHRKKALTRKHAHHEGSRRRWRDEIMIRERRRYEAVWASNRGLFLRPGFAFQHPDVWRTMHTHSSEGGGGATQVDLSRPRDGDARADLVVNIVVRDIWTRSRLPRDELSEVWDLVAGRGGGGPNAASARMDERRTALAKDEFVVGMWLIDQRLRGRKIPARVSESVWESARGGTRVLEPKRKVKR